MAGGITVSGGDHWKKALEHLEKAGQGMQVGIMADAVGDNGLIAPYAFANEFGTPRNPSRPFMRKTFEDRNTAWADGFAAIMKGRTTDRSAVPAALRALGKVMVDDITAQINSSMPPPNSPATLLRKDKDNAGKGTLIDTGSMVKAVTYRINGEN